MRYLVQFPAGWDGLVSQLLQSSLTGFRPVFADDSAIMFDAKATFGQVDDLPFAKNLFLVWISAPRRNVGKTIGQLAATVPPAIRPRKPDPAGFRVMVHIDGGLAPVEVTVRSQLERSLATRTGQRVQSRGGNREYWVMGRRDLDQLLLLERLPRRRKLPTRKGALAPELAAALVMAGGPHPEDRFLDPFAGSGALTLARSRQPARSITYGDVDLANLRADLPGELLRDRRVRTIDDDALILPSIGDHTIDAIVTDPPWGEYEELDRPYPEFAAAMATSLRRVLADGGRLVLLSTRRNQDLITDALGEAGFRLGPAFQILVNGHPASAITAVV
ncbi:MAG: TRM11 family SAM-dependent methyltransferase [Propionibacteriaceae bacterium]